MHVVILAPVNAPALMRYLDEESTIKAAALKGDYGAAPSALTGALIDAGCHVTVISHRRGEGPIQLSGPSLTFIQVDSRRTARQQATSWWRDERRQMLKAVRMAAPDVIHAHWTYEWALAGLASRYPVVISARDAPLTILRYQFDAYRILRTTLAYWVRIRAARATMMAPSPYMAAAWRRQMLWFAPVVVVPNIVPSDLKPLAGMPKSTHPLIVEVADSGDRKNVRGLLRAFGEVRTSLPEAELRLLGTGLGPDDAVAEWASSHDLAEGVEFLGKVDRDEVTRNLSAAWIHAHASFEESFGNTLVEAMSLGTAVVGGERSAAVPWVLGGGEAGVLTAVADPGRFAGDLIRLLNEPERRAQLADAGLARVRQVFAADAIASAHLAVYRQVIRKTKPRKGKGVT